MTKENPPAPNEPVVSEGSSAAPAREHTAHIRSFVLRQGRLSVAQQRNHETLMPIWGIPHAPGLLDYAAVFGRSAPTVLEIGFGMGDATSKIAETLADKNFICLEVHTPGVGSLLKQIDEREIKNIRIIQHDAVEVLRDMIAPGSLAGVHVFFPDPWPKKRQQKRRLLQSPLVHELALRLAPGGYLHCATDWEEYAQQMLEVLGAEPLLENTATDYAERPAYRPETKFEARGLRLGHGVWDVVFRKR